MYWSTSGIISIKWLYFSAISFVIETLGRARLFQMRWLYRDKSVRLFKTSSDKSTSCIELIYIFIKEVRTSISALAILCTLSFLDCVAAASFVDANQLRNSNDDFLNAQPGTVVPNAVYAPLRNSTKISDS